MDRHHAGREIRRTLGGEEWLHIRGWVVQRVFAHDVYHIAEINQALAAASQTQINIWE